MVFLFTAKQIIKNKIRLASLLLVTIVSAFSLQAGISYAYTTSYLPDGSSPPDHKQVKLSSPLSANITSDDTGDAETGGDGLKPVPYRAKDGTLRIWNVYHHQDYRLSDDPKTTENDPGIQSLPAIVCTSYGERCDINKDGAPDDVKRYISTKSGHDITKPAAGEYIITRSYEFNSRSLVSGSKLYVPINVYSKSDPKEGDSQDVGIYCFDMESGEACGYTKLITIELDDITAKSTDPNILVSGIVDDSIVGSVMIESDNKIYVATNSAIKSPPGSGDDSRISISCFKINTNMAGGGSICSDSGTQPYNLPLGTVSLQHGDNATMVSIDKKLYFVLRNINFPLGNKFGNAKYCVDAASPNLSECSNFDKSLETDIDHTTPDPDFDIVGQIIPLEDELCVTYRPVSIINPPVDIKCYDKTTGGLLVSDPASQQIEKGFQAIVDHYKNTGVRDIYNVEYFYNPTTRKTYIAPRALLSTAPNTRPSITLCYDNINKTLCSGFKFNNPDEHTDGVQFWDQVDPKFANAMDYGYEIDDQGCMWGLGDAGILYSFDPETGTYPCYRSKSFTTIDSASELCDPSKGRYVSAKITDIGWQDITSSKIIVKDKNGNIIKTLTPAHDANGSISLDLSEFTTSGDTETITVEAEIKANSSKPWDGHSPKLEVIYAPDTDNGKPYNQPGAGNPLTLIKANGGCIADLELEKKLQTTEAVNVGDFIEYLVTLTNKGPDKATNVVIKEHLPDTVAYVSSETNLGEYDITSSKWRIRLLEPGQSVTLKLKAQIIAVNGNKKNIAEVAPCEDRNGNPSPCAHDPDSTPGNCDAGKNREDDCAEAEFVPTAPTPGRGIGVPVTGALVGKIIAGATGISLVAYLGRDLYLRQQKKRSSER